MAIKINSLSNLFSSFSYTSFCNNGNFESITNWSPLACTLSAESNTLSIVGNGTFTATRAVQDTTLSAQSGNKLFLMAKFKATSSDSIQHSIRVDGTTGGAELVAASISTNLTQDNLLSGICTLTDQTGFVQIILRANYTTAALSNAKTVQVKELIAINLTSLYGAGNEPSAADCLNIFRFVDGTKQPNFSKQIAI